MKNMKSSKNTNNFALMDVILVAAMIVTLVAIAVYTLSIPGM